MTMADLLASRTSFKNTFIIITGHPLSSSTQYQLSLSIMRPVVHEFTKPTPHFFPSVFAISDFASSLNFVLACINAFPNKFKPRHPFFPLSSAPFSSNPIPHILSSGLASTIILSPVASNKRLRSGFCLNFRRVPSRTMRSVKYPVSISLSNTFVDEMARKHAEAYLVRQPKPSHQNS